MKLIYIGLGGFAGAVSRYLISRWAETTWDTIFPTGTLIVNVLGSFLLGLLMTFFMEKTTGYPYLRMALTTGFLGALTTFSTFGYETVLLLEEKSYYLAGINLLGNLVLGVTFVILGIFIARAL